MADRVRKAAVTRHTRQTLRENLAGAQSWAEQAMQFSFHFSRFPEGMGSFSQTYKNSPAATLQSLNRRRVAVVIRVTGGFGDLDQGTALSNRRIKEQESRNEKTASYLIVEDVPPMPS